MTWLSGLLGLRARADLDTTENGDGGSRSGKGVGGRRLLAGLTRRSSAYLLPMK